MKIVECVPNFSEGTLKKTVERIADAIRATEDVTLLDVDRGIATNRTVYTFVGSPEAVLEAAFRAIKVGTKCIDMSNHTGAHPRIGACDVCPFVPVSGVSMEECVKIAQKLGKRVGDELSIPVYLYGHAARVKERSDLSNIREGEYEGLDKKLGLSRWRPDFGPVRFDDHVKKTGATVIGAREFLIAFNINLDSRDRALADEIAKEIREKGKTVTDKKGNKKRVPGKFKACKAIGWYVDEYRKAQVSINLTNYHITGMHHVFEAVKEEALKRGVKTTGSEIVGLVPKTALLDCGRYFAEIENSGTLSEKEAIDKAVSNLGLDEVSPFVPSEKIIEYRIHSDELLAGMSLKAFLDELASSSPAPGGGSVAAAAGSIAAALVSMIGALTCGKKKYRGVWEEAGQTASSAQSSKDRFLELIDEDAEAFKNMMKAMQAGESTPETTRRIIDIPYGVMKLAGKLLSDLKKMCRIGNLNTLSEMAIAARMLRTALYGAFYNILLNVSGTPDDGYAERVVNDARQILQSSEKTLHRLITELEQRLAQSAGM